MTEQVIKKARGVGGHCEVCRKWVVKGDEFVDTKTGLRHKACSNGKPWWVKE